MYNCSNIGMFSCDQSFQEEEMEFELIYNYKDDSKLRKSFNDLSREIFGIDFEEWYEKGFWEDRYECFSIKAGDRIVSNASVNKLDFIVDGERKRALQIGTVMTHENYRGKGLARKLMDFILERFQGEYDIIYLFANRSVVNFYPKFGFTRVKQGQLFSTEKIQGNNRYNFRKLNMDDPEDISILRRIAESSVTNSSSFHIEGGHEILYWYCLNVFRDNIWYDEEEDLIVIYTLYNNNLNIHDMIMTKKKNYREIIGSIVKEDIGEIVFDFSLETENLEVRERTVEDDEDVLFVRGDLDRDTTLIHPVTSHA